MNAMLTVFLKEVRENLRDKRTITNALLTGPLLGPIIFVMMMNLALNRELDKADQPLEVPVIGAEHAPNMLHALRQEGLVAKPPIEHPEAAVRQQLADVVLRIPANFAEAWTKGETAQVEIIYDGSRRDSNTPVNRLKRMLSVYGRRQGAMRLVARGLAPTVASPLVIDERDQSTPEARAGQLFAMLPYFFVLTVFLGGMYLAIDLTAGERERQSMEPLFINPVARWRVLLGKLGAICAFSLASLLISVCAFAVAGRFVPTEKLGMAIGIGPAFAAQVLVLMLPLVALAAVLQTLVAAFAKSNREAQTYLSILMFVPLLPSILLTVVPMKVQDWMFMVPLLGQQMGITQLLRGGAVTTEQFVMTLASGFAATLVVGVVTARVFSSERLAIAG